MTTAPRVLLLDFGGTLDSDGEHWSTQLAGAFAGAGVTAARDALDRAFLTADRALERDPAVAGYGLAEHARAQARLMAAALGVDTALADEAARRFVENARRHLARSAALLAAARAAHALRLGLVSNFTPNLERILEEEGLAPLLDTVACSERVGLRKPDPGIFRLALERLRCGDPAEAAMIGDSLASDVVPAKALGLATVWIRGDRLFVPADESAADHVAGSLDAALICLGLAAQAGGAA